MPIRQLSLTGFRNLQNVTLDFHPSLNLISGDNGSGKTSLLEAIYVLCQGCSFRSHYLKKAIKHGRNNFLVFGRFSDYRAGLSKADQKLEIRLNGETVKKRSLLAVRTPINVINADCFNLIVGSPQTRRAYIDWCAFHVEHNYNESWLSVRHALKQRNRLLKSGKDLKLLDYWDQCLAELSVVLQKYRQQYCAEIMTLLDTELLELVGDMGCSIEYQQGWRYSASLKESLTADRGRDIRAGFTHSGIHRDNMRILVNGYPAAEVLSRGQLKRLSLALLLAALKIVRHKSHRPMILLVDDLRDEMDTLALEKVYLSLMKLDVQLFITNIGDRIPEPPQGKEFKMFHVEHGIIKARKIS